MKLLFTVLVGLAFLTTNSIEAQTSRTSFLIIQSTKNYSAALKKAQLACNNLGFTLNLNNNYKDDKNGLANSEICGCGENHGYIPRGRYDAGNYISIEYSTAYEGFTKGYYIVVVSSGDRDTVACILPKVKRFYKDAYIKDADIYVGCMH